MNTQTGHSNLRLRNRTTRARVSPYLVFVTFAALAACDHADQPLPAQAAFEEDAGTDSRAVPTPDSELAAGWQGPYLHLAAASADALAPCPAAHPDLADELFDGLQAAPAICEGCGFAAKAPACSGRALAMDEASCNGPVGERGASLPLDTCVGLGDVLDHAAAFTFFPAQPQGEATCTPVGTPSMEIDPLKWKSHHRLCEIGTQAPDLASSWCIAQEGVLACTGDTYTEQRVLYRFAQDNRSCTPCEAELTPGTNACHATLEVIRTSVGTNEACEAGPEGTITSYGDDHEPWSAACSAIDYAAPKYVRYVSTEEPSTTAACEAKGWQATGSAEPTQPVTLCCTASN